MAEHVGERATNNAVLLKNPVGIKEEECQDDDFLEGKANISGATPITDSADPIDPLICDKIKQYDVPITFVNVKTELSLGNAEYDMIQDNLKIEEGISVDEIKSEFNNKYLYCEDCQAYRNDYCDECGMLVHILNKSVPMNVDTKSQAELPNDILEIRYYFGEYRIFALKVIPAGVKFGPFAGLSAPSNLWKIQGGKFVVNEDQSKYLNWMRFVNPARDISEQNLQVFQYEHNLYYESTRRIAVGNELLVHFGGEYEDSLNRNVEMDFVPTAYHIFDVFACTFCCLGFSSKSYLAKHKTICPENATGEFTIEELVQCQSCKIHLDQREHLMHHMAYCYERNNRNSILPTPGNRAAEVIGRKTRPCQLYKCQQCKYRTKYKGDLKNHVSMHCEVKTHKCRVCSKRFKTKEILRLHAENSDVCAGRKQDSEHSTAIYTKAHVQAGHSRAQDEMKQFKCSLCEFRTKHQTSLKRHLKVKHLKEFKYKCETCDFKANDKSHLKRHTESKHLREFKCKCDPCDYKTNCKSDLKAHAQAKHYNEFKYKCDICDYNANQKGQLKNHMDSKHLQVFKYKCDGCDYKTYLKSRLNAHVEARHLKEYKYKCDSCDYETNCKSDLKTHVEAKHFVEFKYKCGTSDCKIKWESGLKTYKNKALERS